MMRVTAYWKSGRTTVYNAQNFFGPQVGYPFSKVILEPGRDVMIQNDAVDSIETEFVKEPVPV